MTPPVFSHGKLRLYLLSLLAEQPRHGYEIIQELGDRFGGSYVPSAGTVYPRLSKLEDEGLVTKTAEGRKTVYSITDAGREELASREGELGQLEDDLDDSVQRLANEVRSGVERAMRSLRAELASAASTDRAEARSRATAQPKRERKDQFGERFAHDLTESIVDEAATAWKDVRDEWTNLVGGASSGSGGSAEQPNHAELRFQLRELEAAANDFRQELRAELRDASARAVLSDDVAERVRAELKRAKQAIFALLR